MTTGKMIALTRWTVVDKVMSLLFNMLSRMVITFLLRSAGVQLQQPGIQPEGVSSVSEKLRQPLIFLGMPVYFKLMILFYTFTKALGQRFDIFSSH